MLNKNIQIRGPVAKTKLRRKGKLYGHHILYINYSIYFINLSSQAVDDYHAQILNVANLLLEEFRWALHIHN